MPAPHPGPAPARHARPAILLAGATMAAGLAPLGLGPLAFLALIAVLALGDGAARAAPARPRRRAFALGWLAGLGYFGAGLHWIVEPFFVDAATTGWMAPFGLAGMAGGLALFWGAAFWAAEALGGGVWRRAIALALAETARGFVLTGFPWALIGHVWSGGLLPGLGLHWGALVGPYGLTLLTLLLAALTAWLWRGAAQARRWGRLSGRLLAPACLAGALALIYGGGALIAARPGPADTRAEAPLLRLVQPNAAQHEKWDPAMIPVFFERMVTLSAQPREDGRRPDQVIWPESALSVLLEAAGPALAHVAAEAAAPSIVGLQRRGETPGAYHNSLAAIDASGVVRQVYDKHHLVPFGEYMPLPGFWRSLGIAALAQRAEFGYVPGAGAGPVILDIPGLGRALPLICYEAVFARHARVPGDRPELLLQLTNDAWFGNLVGPWQHLEQARMRAIEQGLPLVRVANTGVSGVIDARGRLVAHLPLDVAGALDATLPPPDVPTLYARTGDLPAFALLALLAAVASAWRGGAAKPH